MISDKELHDAARKVEEAILASQIGRASCRERV